MYTVLRLIRGIVGFIAGWQVLGLLPVAGWISNLGATTIEMWFVVFIKILAMLIFGAAFFWLRALINNQHIKQYGVPHPALTKRWSV